MTKYKYEDLVVIPKSVLDEMMKDALQGKESNPEDTQDWYEYQTMCWVAGRLLKLAKPLFPIVEAAFNAGKQSGMDSEFGKYTKDDKQQFIDQGIDFDKIS